MKGVTAVILAACMLALTAGCAAGDPGAAREDVYRIYQRGTGGGGDRRTDQENACRMGEVFRELEERYGAFLCSTWNYDILDGRRRYEQSGHGDIPVGYDYYGQCITLSAGYFDREPVCDVQGRDVRQLLTRSPDTVDVLVPWRYAGEWERVTAVYQEYMYFHNVEVENIYREALGQEPDRRQAADFSVHIIHMPDDTAYRAYDPAIGLDQIEDCVAVVVHTENMQAVQLSALLTQGLYLPDREGDGAEKAAAVYRDQGYGEGFHSAERVSEQYEKYRREQTAMHILTAAGLLLAVALPVLIFIKIRRRHG